MQCCWMHNQVPPAAMGTTLGKDASAPVPWATQGSEPLIKSVTSYSPWARACKGDLSS